MPQPYDIQLPDILGSYQRGWQMRQQRERAPIENAQRDQTFANQQTDFANSQQDRSDEEIGVIAGLIASQPTTEGRARIYAQAKPKLAPIVSRYGVQLPDMWSDDLMGEVQALQQHFASRKGGGIPAQQQYAQWLLGQVPEADRDQALGVMAGTRARPSSALPFAPLKYTNEEGQEVVEAFDKRSGAANMPGAAASAPQVSAIELAANLERFGGRVTSGFRDPAKNARVGGVSNSFHKTGEAVDVVMPNPKLKAQAKSWMESLGYQVIDEGDHLHAEPPGSPGGSRYASRPAEQQAALNAGATENARIQAQVANTGVVAQSEAQIAAAKAKAEADAKARAERDATADKRAVNAKDALALLDDVDKLLPSSTGSDIGASADRAAAVVGKSTAGAQSASQLRILAGLLTSKVPRMEGPQSNMDVELYKQMAGDLGNDKVPVATRIAAAKGLRRLNEKYAHLNQPQAAQGKQIKRTGTHNGRKVVEYTDGTVSYAD